MAFETKKWLVEELGFTEAEAAELEPKFSGERAKKLEGGVLRQADYSRQMNSLKAEVKKQQDELAAANERLNAEMADWAQVAASGRTQTAQQRADLEKAQQDVLRLTQVVTRVATEAGLDPAKVLGDAAVTPPEKKTEPQAPDLTGYVKSEQLAGVLGSMLDLPAELDAIREEHRELFGKSFDTREVMREVKARLSTKGNTKPTDPRQVWEEMHGIPAKREEVARAKYDAEIRAAEERGAERVRTEASIPGQAPPGKHAPIFRSPSGEQRQSVLQRPQPGQTVQNAVTALRSGKYRPK